MSSNDTTTTTTTALNETDPLLGAADGRISSASLNNSILSVFSSSSSVRESRRFDPLTIRLKDVVDTYWYLGLVAFGGPSAHVAILRDHLLSCNWIDEDAFMELFALGQGLPGPSSTQLVISTASTHGGWIGGFLAFVMWVWPGFLVCAFSGMFLYDWIDPSDPPIWLLGVPPAAIALIFKASYSFCLTLDMLGIGVAMASCIFSVMINGDEHIPSSSSQVVYPTLLLLGGIISFVDSTCNKPIGTYVATATDRPNQTVEDRKLSHKIGLSITQGVLFFLFWLGLLVTASTLVNIGYTNTYLEIFELMFRVGSLVFGGGIVIVPMLQAEVVPAWMTDEQFFQGLGITQTLPGPMFNFAAFLGATRAGFWGAVVGMLGLFGPGFLLIFAMLPFWSRIRHMSSFKAVLKGVNASAIGLIVAGCVFLYAKTVKTAADAMVFILAGGLAQGYRVGAPYIILAGVVSGALLSNKVLNLGQVAYH